MFKVFPYLKSITENEKWLRKMNKSSIGKLLFEDGVYDMDTGEFKKEFDPKIFFSFAIPHKFPEYNKEKIKRAMKISFDSLFDKQKQKRMIMSLATALYGKPLKRMFFVQVIQMQGNPNLDTVLQFILSLLMLLQSFK